MLKRQPLTITLFASLFLSAAAGLLFATRWGIGLSPDSLAYVGAADQLRNGLGFSLPTADGGHAPLGWYAPLFSAVLAATGFVGLAPPDGARWLHAILFGTNVLLVGLVIHKYTDRSLGASIVGSLLMLSSVDMLRVHSMAWSEPLFLSLTLLGLFMLANHLEDGRMTPLIVSASAIALGCLTRYSGLAVVATGLLCLLLFSRQRRRAKLVQSAIFLAISTLPMTLWMIRNLYFVGSPTGRKLVYHPVTMDNLRSGAFTMLNWLPPRSGQSVVGSIVLLTTIASLLALIILLWRSRRGLGKRRWLEQPCATIVQVSATFVVTYGLFLIASISLFDANTPLDHRILSPAYAPALVCGACLASWLWRSVRWTRGVRVAAGVLCAIVVGSYLVRGVETVADLSRDGRGYASRAWSESEIIQRVRALPPEVRIYSNVPGPVAFLTGRRSHQVPSRLDASTGLVDREYPANLVAMSKRLQTEGAVLVWIGREQRADQPSEAELREVLSLQLIERVADGAVYGAGQQGTSGPRHILRTAQAPADAQPVSRQTLTADR